MERAVYFDAWFPRQHCYHPSLPPRRLRMVEELEEMRATVLVWAALGGGSLALPYLEQEAWGEVDERFRFYGFVNDAEFIAACKERGIKVYAVVFQVQGWEFPVELSEAEDRVLALNETRSAGRRDWLGLREFSQNRYPKLWPPFERYFPDGLRNSLAEPVTDLLLECCSRDIYGEPCHAHWVECPDREHYCYTMDRNNPVWREYLKAIVRIQIDAGAEGIQFDEAELPMTSLQYGGCFCRSCMDGFRDHLLGLAPGDLPRELDSESLEDFHYGTWLLERGYDFKDKREETPLFWDYMRFQRAAITRYFGELADYARDYAASQGKEVSVSGNFFNLFDHYYALEPKVDLVLTEMRNTTYRQPAWYRYVAGFAGPKPVVVVENPYGGVVPELVEQLKVGRGYDLFRMSCFEAAALGASMSMPYGSWLGSEIEDAFYAPQPLCAEIQGWLAEHDDLFSAYTLAEVGVVFSIESNFRAMATRDLFADNRLNVSADVDVLFWTVCERLSEDVQPYDVVFFPDGTLRADSLRPEDLAGYRTLVLPDCSWLTDRQAEVLREYLEAGGAILALGRLGANLEEPARRAVADHPGCTTADAATFSLDDLPHGPQLTVERAEDMAVNLCAVEAGAALHFVRYGYDAAVDAVPVLDRLVLRLRLPRPPLDVVPFSPLGPLKASHATSGPVTTIELREVPLYGGVLLRF